MALVVPPLMSAFTYVVFVFLRFIVPPILAVVIYFQWNQTVELIRGMMGGG